MHIMYQKAHLIHGDLSEYNILIDQGTPYFIDFPQAIDMSLRENRFPKELKQNLLVMQKDLQPITEYFEKKYHLTFDYEEIYHYIIGKDAQKKEGLDGLLEEIEVLKIRN